TLSNVSRGRCAFAIGRNRRRSAGGQNFEPESGDVEIGLDAIEVRLRVALGIDVDGRKRVRAESFGDSVALFVGFSLLPCFIERLNQEGAIFGVVGLTLDGF